MSFVWICALLNDSESGRKFALISWIVLIVGAARIYYLTVILNGSALDHFCDTVETVQDAAGELVVSRDDCLMGGKNGMLFDCIFGWLFDIYWGFVIMRWSRSDVDGEGWNKA